MTAKMIDGKSIAKSVEERLQKKAELLSPKWERPPIMAVVMVGAEAPSRLYVRKKQEACERVGMRCHVFHLPETASQSELLALIQELNEDPAIDGMILQLPLPPGHGYRTDDLGYLSR